MIGGTTRTGRFVRALSFGYFNMALTLVVGLWLTPLYLWHLGQESYGVWLMLLQALMYLSLMDFGIVALLSRETAFAVGRAGSAENAADVPEIVGRALRLVLWQLPLVAMAAAVLWFLAPTAMRTGPLAWLLVIVVLRFPLRVYQEVLVGIQDIAYIGALQLVSFVIATAITVAMVFAGWGLYSLVAGWAFGQAIPAVASWVRLKRRFPFLLPSTLPALPWTVAKRNLASGAWVSVAQIAHLFVYGSDVLILGYMLGPAAVVPYVCTGKLVSVLQNQPQLIMETARPALSELRAGRHRDRLRGITSALTLAVLLVGGLVACGIAIVNRGFTSFWVGEQYFGGTALTVSLVSNMLLRLWNASTVYAIFAFGYERRISVTTLADGLLTSVLALVLIPWMGPIGAPLASMISVVLVSLPWNLSALASEANVSRAGLVYELRGWFVRLAVVFVLAAWAGHNLVSVNLAVLAAVAVAVTCAYVVIMLPIVRRPPAAEFIQPIISGFRTRASVALRRHDASA